MAADQSQQTAMKGDGFLRTNADGAKVRTAAEAGRLPQPWLRSAGIEVRDGDFPCPAPFSRPNH